MEPGQCVVTCRKPVTSFALGKGREKVWQTDVESFVLCSPDLGAFLVTRTVESRE